MKRIVAVDIGTTYIKSILFGEKGEIQQEQKCITPLEKEEFGDIYRAETIWQIVRAQVDSLFKECAEKPVGISVTGMAEAGLVLNRNTAMAVTDIIPWFDKRTEKLSAKMNAQDARAAFRSTGLYNSYKYGIYKFLWLLRQYRIDQANAVWMSICDYILYRMTGEIRTEPTFAARTYVYDIRKCGWDEDRIRGYGLEVANFPQVVPSGTCYDSCWGIPAALAGHDHICAAFAVLFREKAGICNSAGTSETYIGRLGADMEFSKTSIGRTDMDLSEASIRRTDMGLSEAGIGRTDTDLSEASIGRTDMGLSEVSIRRTDMNLSEAGIGRTDMDFSEAGIGRTDMDFSEAGIGRRDTDIEFSESSGLIYGPYSTGGYYYMANIPASGHSVEWYRRKLQNQTLEYEEMNRQLEAVPNNPTGILYFPYLTGMGTPLYRPGMGGALLGLRESHTGPEILRGMIEGIQYQSRWLLEIAGKYHGAAPDRLVCAGGSVRNRTLLQIKADVLGLPAFVPAVSEATLVGAAAVYLYRNEGTASCEVFLAGHMQIREKYLPNKENTKIYQSIFADRFLPMARLLSEQDSAVKK